MYSVLKCDYRCHLYGNFLMYTEKKSPFIVRTDLQTVVRALAVNCEQLTKFLHSHLLLL
jgi:hypothetical protein